MDLTIEQTCPTCGAPITLHEDDRLIQCPFCDGHNYMVHRQLPRFALPAKLCQSGGQRLIYVPYLRFKGTIYSCQEKEVRHNIVDTTRIGVIFLIFPFL